MEDLGDFAEHSRRAQKAQWTEFWGWGGKGGHTRDVQNLLGVGGSLDFRDYLCCCHSDGRDLEWRPGGRSSQEILGLCI